MMRNVKNNYASGISGFTFVEMLVVVTILVIAAILTVPLMSSAAQNQLQAAAQVVASDMEYVRSMAISRCNTYSIIFDPANNSYEVQDNDGVAIPHPLKGGAPFVVVLNQDSRLSRVTFTSAEFDGDSTVTFDYLGSPFNDTGSSLSSGQIKLNAGDAAPIFVNVEPLTGYVTIQ